ncbi:aspartic protease [Aspergillus terreus]|uniref:Aspartic protease n=1 Tax=Aspergillus terreus TaxID=33178 RepID=A0A5M3Z8Z4_ASPTE|nr:hypothetical protein ATETN484_0012004200 [Aspergillus terreus]GFF19290.1 aspartic protease [Aspergillus terreus]
MKGSWLYAISLLCSLCINYVHAQALIAPWGMSWSSQKFGPDGPWNAVSVRIGGNKSEIALYPGAAWTSEILLSTICENTTVSSYCYGDQAGLFDPAQSSTYDDSSIMLAPNGGWSNILYGYTNAVPIYAEAKRALDSIDIGGSVVPSADLITISQGYQIYPEGNEYPLQVGVLSLGSPEINQTFTTSGVPINGTFVTSHLYETGTIPSYSYGMHIGSAALNIPGSLYLGGYDRSRVIGEVSSQPVDGGACPIQLVDIDIGVAAGASPWNSSSMTGLLMQGNASMASGVKVNMDPTNPYIYLPHSSCDAVAAKLPVTYNSALGLYFWNTDSPLYTRIITSPSYLAFTFLKNGANTAHITIKVPFALLNLTLDAPLVSQPTPYFPCMGTDSDLALGRAFLQAAFMGVHWSKGRWFLAQAPGPDGSFIKDVANIDTGSTTIAGSGNSWEGTWENSWTPLASTNSTNTTVANSNGLSIGAKAGIGVGCAVAGLLIFAVAFWLFRRRRGHHEQLSHSDICGKETAQPSYEQMAPVEIADTKPDSFPELGHGRDRGYAQDSILSSQSGQTFTNSVGGQGIQQFPKHSNSDQQNVFELATR